MIAGQRNATKRTTPRLGKFPTYQIEAVINSETIIHSKEMVIVVFTTPYLLNILLIKIYYSLGLIFDTYKAFGALLLQGVFTDEENFVLTHPPPKKNLPNQR